MRNAYMAELSGTFGDKEPWQHPLLWQVVEKFNVKGLFLDPRDANVNNTCLSYFRDKGIVVGIFRNPADRHDTAQMLADRLHTDLINMGQNGKQCRLCANIEYPYRDDYPLRFFMALTKLRPQREKYWIVEGHQGGWIKNVPGLVPYINTEHYVRAVQAEDYDGQMNPIPDKDTRQDLLDAGITPAKAMICYDGKRASSTAEINGTWFTFERLLQAA